MAAVAIEATFVAFRETPELLGAGFFSRLRCFLAPRLAIRGSLIALLLLVTLESFVTNFLADPFATCTSA